MTKFIKGEKLSQRQSKTTEEYDERDVLLTDIRARIDDYEQVGAEKRQAAKRKTEGIQNSGLVMRQLAMDELASSSSDLPNKKKSKRPAPTVNINALVETIQTAIDEKKQREKRVETLQSSAWNSIVNKPLVKLRSSKRTSA
ncbi:unnamed protein product [Aphanomyces euteiches]|uniref:Uncharacterized protein n=1 Tax=Aphanomyces euteiches TaxID=100861 RepID=A0A6G0W4B7_9STRA|nr:hypothetical protein Ae201684_018911 [Aphanomyces euteiches]KAH9089538.1 hypothetical protein Ae201684P_007707 [Aphanomyces euteiches]KAH9141060.1 hypothetical protein AeRB84_014721 [Aphanomyces euteiches]